MAPMPPMTMAPPPSGDTPPMPPMPPMDNNDMPAMHAAFFWGHRAQVLFSNWPGDRDGAGMYVLCLLAVAALAALAEVLAAWSRALAVAGRGGGGGGGGALGWMWTVQVTWIHALKMGLLYLVMLAAMSFNGGVFLAVVAGHAAGFLAAQRWTLLRRPAASGDDGVHANGAAAVPPASEEPKP